MTTHSVICHVCGSANRIPAEHEGQVGKCGKCRAPLPPLYSKPQVLTERSFDPFIRHYPGPVLAEFWAPW